MRNKGLQKNQKLVLSKSTIRVLTADQLNPVRGGTSDSAQSDECGSTVRGETLIVCYHLN